MFVHKLFLLYMLTVSEHNNKMHIYLLTLLYFVYKYILSVWKLYYVQIFYNMQKYHLCKI